MTNEEKYNFSDFTVEGYKKCLDAAKKNYVFRKFSNFKKDEKFVLWRHDIDASVHRAKRLAEVEAEKGLTSTFLIHLHSEFYNIAEKNICKLLSEIYGMGHSLGLHFDTHFYNITNEAELEEKILFEKKILETFLSIKIDTLSFHNTNPFIMSLKAMEYGGLVNVNAEYFQSNLGYCSDSNGHWRYRRLMDVVKKATDERLQVLTHPEWWQETVMSPFEKIKHTANTRAKDTIDYYDNLLRSHNINNIDW